MVSQRDAKKLRQLEQRVAAFDTFESMCNYFVLLIDEAEVTNQIGRLQESLLALRDEAQNDFREAHDRIIGGDGVESSDQSKE